MQQLHPVKKLHELLLHMKIEIWSDVVCPFCYIGKRHFEKAVAQLPFKDEMEVEWRSFQLNPDLQHDPSKDLYTYLAELKGQTREWSVTMHAQVSEMALAAGLHYRFDIAKLANSFDAHRLIQLARKHGISDVLEEALFRAYFTEGALISDHVTLTKLAVEAGLNKDEVERVLAGSDFTEEVENDIREAAQIGVRGVPFFVIDRKYAVSGAQPVAQFVGALTQAYEERGKCAQECYPPNTPGK